MFRLLFCPWNVGNFKIWHLILSKYNYKFQVISKKTSSVILSIGTGFLRVNPMLRCACSILSMGNLSEPCSSPTFFRQTFIWLIRKPLNSPNALWLQSSCSEKGDQQISTVVLEILEPRRVKFEEGMRFLAQNLVSNFPSSKLKAENRPIQTMQNPNFVNKKCCFAPEPLRSSQTAHCGTPTAFLLFEPKTLGGIFWESLWIEWTWDLIFSTVRPPLLQTCRRIA